jgi:hypothetical protein
MRAVTGIAAPGKLAVEMREKGGQAAFLWSDPGMKLKSNPFFFLLAGCSLHGLHNLRLEVLLPGTPHKPPQSTKLA